MLKKFVVFNAILFAALGVAFAVYAPPLMNFFEVPELAITPETYWHLTAFARMFGAGLFGWGMTLWAFSRGIEAVPAQAQRSMISAQVLACLIAAIVALTSQSSIWYTAAGWAVSGMFILLTLGYGYMLARMRTT